VDTASSVEPNHVKTVLRLRLRPYSPNVWR